MGMAGCQDKDRPNPCVNQQPTSADFVIRERIGIDLLNKVRLYEVDTVGISSRIPITFSAKDTVAARYQWTVGNDPRVYTQREISLAFDQLNGPVTVRLRVQKTPNTACFPNDTGEATAQKTLVLVPQAQAPIYGDYEGYSLSNPGRKFTIQIRPNSLLNLPEGCRYDLRNEVLIGSTALFAFSNTFDPPFGAASLSGWGALDRQNKRKIVFEYSYTDLSQPTPTRRLNDTFVGFKR